MYYLFEKIFKSSYKNRINKKTEKNAKKWQIWTKKNISGKGEKTGSNHKKKHELSNIKMFIQCIKYLGIEF